MPPNPDEIKILLTKEHYDYIMKSCKENASDSFAAERLMQAFIFVIDDATKVKPVSDAVTNVVIEKVKEEIDEDKDGDGNRVRRRLR